MLGSYDAEGLIDDNDIEDVDEGPCGSDSSSFDDDYFSWTEGSQEGITDDDEVGFGDNIEEDDEMDFKDNDDKPSADG